MKLGKLEIEWETLEAIARYYEFPSAVFLLPMGEWEKPKLSGTRLDNLVKDQEKLGKIREILEEQE